MKKILVTGCNGQLGRAIRKEYANDAVEFVNTDVVEGEGVISLDITDVDAVLKLARETRPDVIINCAAHTNVDKCEEQWDLAYKINALGPRNLSIAAAELDAKMIHVSTDYVFDGKGTRPYTEFDAVSPNSAYGKTKLEGECFVQQFSKKFFIIRTAWMYGDGKNFARTMLRLSETNSKVSVVNDQIGSPTSSVELAKLIHFLEPSDNYGLFHGTCEGSCSWADFAREVFRLAGKDTEVEGISTEEYNLKCPTAAVRPAYSVLDNYMLKLTSDYKMAEWQEAIAKYMKEI